MEQYISQASKKIAFEAECVLDELTTFSEQNFMNFNSVVKEFLEEFEKLANERLSNKDIQKDTK